MIAGVVALFVINANKKADYIVETNAFFAPFEFYEGRQIKGVDVEIIERVAKKMNKKIDIKDVEFDVIIDNVEAGKIADAVVEAKEGNLATADDEESETMQELVEKEGIDKIERKPKQNNRRTYQRRDNRKEEATTEETKTEEVAEEAEKTEE